MSGVKVEINDYKPLSPIKINTMYDDINQKVEQGLRPREESLQERLEPIVSSNQIVIERLTDNYNQLLKLNELKEKELMEAKADAKKAKAYNVVMMIISIVSMLAAIVAWLVPNILEV